MGWGGGEGSERRQCRGSAWGWGGVSVRTWRATAQHQKTAWGAGVVICVCKGHKASTVQGEGLLRLAPLCPRHTWGGQKVVGGTAALVRGCARCARRRPHRCVRSSTASFPRSTPPSLPVHQAAERRLASAHAAPAVTRLLQRIAWWQQLAAGDVGLLRLLDVIFDDYPAPTQVTHRLTRRLSRHHHRSHRRRSHRLRRPRVRRHTTHNYPRPHTPARPTTKLAGMPVKGRRASRTAPPVRGSCSRLLLR